MSKDKVIVPPLDGSWYATERGVQHGCKFCPGRHVMTPTVAAYVEKLDHGHIQERTEPGWKENGWLACWECPKTGRYWYEAVPVSFIQYWGAARGPWGRAW